MNVNYDEADQACADDVQELDPGDKTDEQHAKSQEERARRRLLRRTAESLGPGLPDDRGCEQDDHEDDEQQGIDHQVARDRDMPGLLAGSIADRPSEEGLLIVPVRKPGMVRPRRIVAGNAGGWTFLARRPVNAMLRWPQDHWPREPVIPPKADPLRVCKIPGTSKDQLMRLSRWGRGQVAGPGPSRCGFISAERCACA